MSYSWFFAFTFTMSTLQTLILFFDTSYEFFQNRISILKVYLEYFKSAIWIQNTEHTFIPAEIHLNNSMVALFLDLSNWFHFNLSTVLIKINSKHTQNAIGTSSEKYSKLRYHNKIIDFWHKFVTSCSYAALGLEIPNFKESVFRSRNEQVHVVTTDWVDSFQRLKLAYWLLMSHEFIICSVTNQIISDNIWVLTSSNHLSIFISK